MIYRKLILFSVLLSTILYSQVSVSLQSSLESMLNQERKAKDLKGVSAAIIFPDNTMWVASSGVSSDVDSLLPEMLMPIGSITKTFVAALTLELITDNYFSLEDSIYHWVPENPNIDSTVTIKQLLQHTSGIYNITDHPGYVDSIMGGMEKIWTAEEVLLAFVDSMLFEPGTDWGYSNTNYVILGMMIENVTQMTLGELLRAYYFTPFNLEETYLGLQEPEIGEMAHLWYDLFDVGSVLDVSSFGFSTNAMFSITLAAGGIVSSAKDAANWIKLLMERQVLPDTLLDKMMDMYVVSNSYEYGLGLAKHIISGNEYYGHSGDALYKSIALYQPSDSISIALLFNDGSVSSSEMKSIANKLVNECVIQLSSGLTMKEEAGEEKGRGYPNPFINGVKITSLQVNGQGQELSILNILGETMFTTYLNTDSFYWNGMDNTGSKVPDGVYYVKITGNRYSIIPLIKVSN